MVPVDGLRSKEAMVSDRCDDVTRSARGGRDWLGGWPPGPPEPRRPKPPVKIDIGDKARHNADYTLTVADLKAWEREHGRIPNESAVILWTGWASRWGTPAYANLDADGRIHQPGFGLEAAQWLVDTGRL